MYIYNTPPLPGFATSLFFSHSWHVFACLYCGMAPLEATVSPGGCLRGTNCSFGSNDAFLSIGSRKQFIGSHEQLEFICSSLAVHLQFIGSHYQLDLRICDLQHSVCSSHVYIYIYVYMYIYIGLHTYIYVYIYIHNEEFEIYWHRIWSLV